MKKNTNIANETKERLNETLIKIIDKVEEAGSWVKPFKASIASGAPANAQTGKYYNGINVLNLWITAQDKGYNSHDDVITMPHINDFVSAEEFYSTLGHEYIHSTGHKTRLDRPLGNKFGSEAYAYEELIAELGSCLLMAQLGLTAEPVQDNSAAYLKSWLKKLRNDPKQLWKAASAASKAADRLQQAAALRADKRKAA